MREGKTEYILWHTKREHKPSVTSPRLERWQPLLTHWGLTEKGAASYSVWTSRHTRKLGTQSRAEWFFFREQKRKRSKEAKTVKRKVGYKCIVVISWKFIKCELAMFITTGRYWIIQVWWNPASSNWPLLQLIPNNPNTPPPFISIIKVYWGD